MALISITNFSSMTCNQNGCHLHYDYLLVNYLIIHYSTHVREHDMTFGWYPIVFLIHYNFTEVLLDFCTNKIHNR